MGYQYGSFFFLPDDLSNIVAYRKPGLIIQGGEGLVKEEKLRVKGQGADQSRSLRMPPESWDGRESLNLSSP